MSTISKLIRSGSGIVCLASFLAIGSGCNNIEETPHVANPLHWGTHITKIFGWEDGSLHLLHIDIDRILFGVENYQEFEETEIVYSD